MAFILFFIQKAIKERYIKFSLFFVFVVGFSCLHVATARADDPWYNSSWRDRIKITVNTSQVPSTQTSFPVYVNLADLPAGFFSHVKSDGSDIRVTNSSGTTELPIEVVAINTGASTGELWFKADSISNGSYYYIYYNDSGASAYAVTDTYGRNNVWDSNYQMVVHLAENAANTTVNDSTGHVTNITTNGNTTVYTSTYHDAGKVGSGFNINSAQQGVKLNNAVTINTNHTMSVWVNQTSLSGYQNIFAAGSSLGYWILAGKLSYYSSGDHTETTANTTGTWTYLTATMDGTNLRFYRNGSPDGTVAFVNTVSANGFGGDGGANGERLFGSMDEEEISNIARSADWIKTEYNNQNSTSAFYSVSGEQAGAAIAPGIPTGLSTQVANTQVNLSWTAPADDGGSTITDYVIEYKLTSGSSWAVFADGVSTSTTGIVTGLTNGVSYDFRVSAVNAVGQGSASSVATAVPAITYTVTYNGNSNTSGSVPVDSNTYAPGATVTVLSNSGGLAKNGYTFSGWNTSSDGNGTDRAAASTFAIGSANVTLYAKWIVSACTATGGTITTSGGYSIYTFTSSGTFTVTSGNCNAEVLVVAGGGGSGGGVTNAYGPGGGGAGGLIYSASYALTSQAYSVTVGDGGAGGAAGNNYGSNGQNSVFGTLTAIGGGGGAGNDNASPYTGSSGGSGGGGSRLTGAGGAGTAGQGNHGGKGNDLPSNYGGGGGGGSGGVGADGTSGGGGGGAGGIGTASSISGSPVTYAAGGLGGSYNGGYASSAGTTNTGNGAGAGSTGPSAIAGAKGGSGIVIIAYLTNTVPGAPTSVILTSGNAQVGLSWITPASNGGAVITDYVIEYKLTSGSSWSVFADGVSTDTTSTVTGLTNGVSYDFRVSAVNSVGQGVASNVVSSTPASVQPILTVSATSTQLVTTTIANSPGYMTMLGGAFTAVRNAGTANITSITLTQKGSLATSYFSNVSIYFKQENPCESQINNVLPSGTTLFGSLSSFSGNAITITNTSGHALTISTSNTCIYVQYTLTGDPTVSTLPGQSVDLHIENPTTDVVMSGATISPSTPVNIPGITTIQISSSQPIKSLLSLEESNPTDNPTIFYVSNGSLFEQQGTQTPVQLTPQGITVTAATFTNITPTNGLGSVSIGITLEKIDPNNGNAVYSQTFHTTASVKSTLQ